MQTQPPPRALQTFRRTPLLSALPGGQGVTLAGHGVTGFVCVPSSPGVEEPPAE